MPSSGRKSLQVGRNSLDGLVCHSARSSIGRKSLLKFLSHANFCRTAQVTRGGRAQVVGRSLIGRKASRVSWRSIASVSRRSGRGCGSGARVYADRLTNGVRGSRARKPRGAVASHSYHLANHTLLLLVCQSLPHIDVNARLRSDDQSLTTAHESKKSGILQLVNRLVAIRCKPSIIKYKSTAIGVVRFCPSKSSQWYSQTYFDLDKKESSDLPSQLY